MQEDDQDRLLDEIRAAKPGLQPSAQEWAGSERGQRVLRQVLADVGTADSVSSRRMATGRGTRSWVRLWTSPRLVIGAVALVLAVLAVCLAVLLPGRVTDAPAVVEGQPTTLTATPTTAKVVDQVTKLAAVEHVMELDRMKESAVVESVVGPATTDDTSWLGDAIERGLIAQSEVSSGSAAEPILQGQYAVLLWKAFGPYVSGTTATTGPVPGTVDPDEVVAIQGLQSAGVIREADGVFVADGPLDSEQERLLLARIEQALRGQVPQ